MSSYESVSIYDSSYYSDHDYTSTTKFQDATDSQDATESQETSVSATDQAISLMQADPPGEGSVDRFYIVSIAAAIMASLNKFRESCHRTQFEDDHNLTQIALNHSFQIAKKEIECGTVPIGEKIQPYPFVVYSAHVTQRSVEEPDAFIHVVNTWTTDPVISKSILDKYNCASAGFYVSDEKIGYFTLILGLRSVLGFSYFSGSALKSILLAEQCLSLLNVVRVKRFQLRKMKIDLRLCDFAYRFVGVDKDTLTKDYIRSKIGKFSSEFVTFGVVNDTEARPETIVKEWLDQVGKNMSYLGDFNRIGIGFKEIDGKLRSVIILVRSMRAAIVDGSEELMESASIESEIVEVLNRFREQHKLEPVAIDELLSEAAQLHSVFVANGQKGPDPLDDDRYTEELDANFTDTDVTHFSCCEMARAAQLLMNKWRNDENCVSVILNNVSDIGVGVAFDETWTCHITVIIGARGEESEVVNRIVHF